MQLTKTDTTVQMHGLVWVFVMHTYQKVSSECGSNILLLP